MSFKSNSPALSYISWNNCYITYGETDYFIQDSYTCKKYIYWNALDPHKFQISDRLLDEVGGRFLIALNDKGIYSMVSLNGITLTFTEETGNPALISTVIQGFHESFDATGEKFAAVEKSIEGIESNVGNIQKLNDVMTQDISTLKQTSTEIDAQVQKVTKEFNDNKSANELRENVSSAMLNFGSILGAFSSDMSSYMEDNNISSSEKANIETYKTNLLAEQSNVNTQINLILDNLQQNGETDNYNNLKSQQEAYNNAVSTLKTIIETAVADNIITSSEMTNVTTAFSSVNTKMLLLNNTLDQIVFLGVGGTMIEEVSKFNMQSNQILLSVSKVEQTIKNNLNLAKSSLQTQITDLYTAIDKVDFEVDVAIEDREVSNLEKTNVSNALTYMNEEFEDVENKYLEIINNENLTDETKQRLTSLYDLLVPYKENFERVVNNVFSDNMINDAEINQITQSITDFKDNINSFHQNLSLSLDEIEGNEWNRQLNEAKATFAKEVDELQLEINNVSSSIDDAISSGLIDELEKENMLSVVSELEREKTIIDEKFNRWYSDEYLLGEDKTNYKNIYDTFVQEYNDLVDLINTIANSDKLVSETDKENVELAKESFNDAIAKFYAGSDYVINVIGKNEVDYLNTSLKKELLDANNAINTLEVTLNEVIADTVITETEMAKINGILVQIEKEKEEIDKVYSQVYNNTNLK